jgi:hypothetical protein
MNVTYISSDGKSYPLTMSMRMRLKDANFHNYSWMADASARQYGERIDAWRKEAAKYPATIAFRGTHQQRREKVDDFHSSIERDCYYNSPGKLVWGEWYARCFVISSSTYPADFDMATTINDVEIYCPYPFWVSEQYIDIAPTSETVLRATDKQYNAHYGYPYSYMATAGTSRQIFIDHYAPCDFRAVLYGAQSTMNVIIGNVHLIVNHAIPEGGYMVVDTRQDIPADKHCYLVAGGTETNCFNDRDPQATLLDKVEPGSVTVTYNRHSRLELTIYRERSEPAWR